MQCFNIIRVFVQVNFMHSNFWTTLCLYRKIFGWASRSIKHDSIVQIHDTLGAYLFLFDVNENRTIFDICAIEKAAFVRERKKQKRAGVCWILHALFAFGRKTAIQSILTKRSRVRTRAHNRRNSKKANRNNKNVGDLYWKGTEFVWTVTYWEWKDCFFCV